MEEQDLIDLITTVLMIVIMVVSYFFGYAQGKHDEKRKSVKKEDKEPAPKSYWNHRIATRLLKHPLEGRGFWREFLVIECHYTDGKPRAYGEAVRMNGYEVMEEIKTTNEQIIKAFDKPVIDLDNFPNEYKL
jgi:hypothetical protein